MVYVPGRKACEVLGVCNDTLRRWADENKIKYIRTPTGHRKYDLSSVLPAKVEHKISVCYCRVSSAKQKDDLERQQKYMLELYPDHTIVSDIGSGLNYKRQGLTTLLERVCRREVSEIVVAHKDRLCRFGFELFAKICKIFGTRLVVLDEVSLSPEQELVQDVLAILTVFSCRIHGLRKYSNKIKKDTNLSDQNPRENT